MFSGLPVPGQTKVFYLIAISLVKSGVVQGSIADNQVREMRLNGGLISAALLEFEFLIMLRWSQKTVHI